MKSLLDALQSGRLVELPSTDKEAALKTLGHLIEAVPEMSREVDLVGEILKRERAVNSGIGLGVACPHVRVNGHGELLCSVGWSPGGIEYGSTDGKRVHLVAMYFIPDAQKNAYLKEISGLAEAIQKKGDVQTIAKADDIAHVREQLLGWVSGAIETGLSQIRARMIQLESRQARADSGVPGPLTLMFPLLILNASENQRIVLCENKELSATLEKDPTIAVAARNGASFDRAGYRFLHRSSLSYDPSRPLHEFIAVKLG
jgi:PTS system nitrogen regulatory IIA component